jgi:hypothetical protein
MDPLGNPARHPARPRSDPGGPTAAVGSGSPDPSRDRPPGGRLPAFTADGPGDPTAGRVEADRPGSYSASMAPPVLAAHNAGMSTKSSR